MAMGFASQLALDTASPVAHGYEFESCSITLSGSIVDSSGIRGTRSRFSERTRAGNQQVGGTIELYPSAEDLANLLPLVLGGTASSGTYPLGEALTPFTVVHDKVAKVLTYAGCVVNRATFSGSEGQAVKLSLDVIGKTETIGAAGTFPSVSFNADPPYMFTDSLLTMQAAARSVKQWTLTIDNMVEALFYNSQTATLLLAKDRAVTLDCTNPFTASDTDLYNQALAGAAATLALANGDKTLTFSFATLQVPPQGPTVGGRQEIPLELSAVARKVGSAAELVVTIA